MWLLIAFLAVPLIEIALFIQVGGWIGLGWTLATVVVTALLGTYMVRSQGLATLERLRGAMGQGQDPTDALVHGAMILFAGALLLTPGFFTDAVGFSFLLPRVRIAIFAFAKTRMQMRMSTMAQAHAPQNQQSTVIDGEFEEIQPGPPRRDGSSGWTKH